MSTVTDCELKYGSPADGSRFLEVAGVRLHYRDKGRGPTLLALHGIADSLHTWNRWAPVLEKDYRFIRLDLPGFGLSGRMPGTTIRWTA